MWCVYRCRPLTVCDWPFPCGCTAAQGFVMWCASCCRRRKAAQEGAVANFRTLLNEMVKDPEAHWQDWRPRLERDPQV